MPRRLPKYCCEDVDRYGNVRVYLRKDGRPKVRLRGMAWTPEFMKLYEQALNSAEGSSVERHVRSNRGTWRWLCQQYFACAKFRRLNESTKIARRRLLENTFEEPIHPGAKEVFGDMPLHKMTQKAVQALRDRKSHLPFAADGRVKAIRLVFSYALKAHKDLVGINPAREVELFAVRTDGIHTWTIAEIFQFMERHGEGTKARLAMVLMFYAGARLSDVVLLGRQMVRRGWLYFKPEKTIGTSGGTVEIPVHPALAVELNVVPKSQLNFLLTEYGKPFSKKGFGNWLKERCREAGLHHCSAHGLRKAAATIAAENGATEQQLMAMFGWSDPQMATLYTRNANKRKLAGDGMQYLRLEQNSI